MKTLEDSKIGSYTISGIVGKGGMAQLYRAYQSSMDREVALKILPENLTHDDSFVRRFRKEAKAIAKMQHPHILPVYDFGEADGQTYIVMPLIKGGTLKDMLNSGPLPLGAIRRIVSQVGSALEYAHQHGLIHRDIKPSNILIDESGNCLLSDFGLVKEVESDSNLTESGIVMGTPMYMSPEQGLGKPIDKRTDIYALGVILFEMATGRVPYDADTPMGIVLKHVSEPIPAPRQFNASLPGVLVKIIEKAMAKKPDDRYESVGDMAQAIQSAIQESGEVLRTSDETATTLAIAEPTAKGLPEIHPTRQAKQPSALFANRWRIAGAVLIFALVGTAATVAGFGGTLFGGGKQLNTVCFNADSSGMGAGDFQGIVWKGIQDGAANFGAEPKVVIEEFDDSGLPIEGSFQNNLEQLASQDCDVIIASGFYAVDHLAQGAKLHPDQKYVILDATYDPPLANVWAQDYATDEAAFLAGYVAASVSKTGKVGTFGGFQFPSIETYMDGFTLGVDYYNETQGTSVEVLGWDVESREGYFIDSFFPKESGHDITKQLIEEGADVIFPVAGAAGLGAADIALENDGVYVIGVDTDMALTNPEYASVTLTSVEKRFNLSLIAAMNAINKGEFEGGTHLGDIANGEIGLAPYHELDHLVPGSVVTDLIQIKASIINGKIKTKP